MREARTRAWKAAWIGATLGGVATVVGVVADLTTIGPSISEFFGHPQPETEAAAPTGRTSPSPEVSGSPPPPELESRRAPVKSPHPRPEAPPRPAFPLQVSLDAKHARTLEGVEATVSVSFHTVGGEEITTLRILPRGGEPVVQPFVAAGGFVGFTSGRHSYRIQVVAIEPGAREVELVIDRTD